MTWVSMCDKNGNPPPLPEVVFINNNTVGLSSGVVKYSKLYLLARVRYIQAPTLKIHSRKNAHDAGKLPGFRQKPV